MPRVPKELPLFDYNLLEFFDILGVGNAVKLFICVLLEHQVLLVVLKSSLALKLIGKLILIMLEVNQLADSFFSPEFLGNYNSVQALLITGYVY